MSAGKDPKPPILAEVSEHRQKLRQSQIGDVPVATTFDPLGRMKEFEESEANNDELYYIETVDDEESEKENDLNLIAEREEMNRNFDWGWYRLSEK